MRTPFAIRGMAMLLLAGSAASLSQGSSPGSNTPSSGSMALGQRAFLQYCAMCYGDRGRGDGELATAIRRRAGVTVANLADRGRIERLGRTGVRRVVTLGGAHTGRSNLMPAWGERLAAPEMDHLVDFVMGLPDQAPGSAAATVPGYAETLAGAAAGGRAIFVHQCSGCHGLAARGDGPLAESLIRKRHVRPRDLTDSSYMARRTDRELSAVITQGGGPTGKSNYMPHWGGYLSAAQIKDLVSYVRMISHTAPRP